MANNQLTAGRTGYVIPDRLYDLPWVDRNRIVSEHRGRIVRDLDRDERVHLARSLRLSRARIDGALGVRCTEHDVAPGVACFGGSLSGVRGLCRARYECGAVSVGRSTFRPEELARLAEAARNAQQHARARMLRANRPQAARGVSR